MDQRLYVHAEAGGRSQRVGHLWTRFARGRNSATFEYDPAWLASPDRYAIQPNLPLGRGAFHTAQGRDLFGAFGDSAPDRWGRLLIKREEGRKAREENRQGRSLAEADFLLGVGDVARQGALRFKDSEDEDAPFLATGNDRQVPPLVQLGALLNAAMNVEADGGSDDDLKLVLAPGASLGGARPKASVLDADGALSIAKFPKRDERTPVNEWEALALTLARKSGITTATFRLETVGDRSALILRRFDRQGGLRTPYLSGMSLIDAVDNETRSYLELADALRQDGASPKADCAELWRRIVFSILISNTDDHLRNHGFLYDVVGGGWRLAPIFDVNPTSTADQPRITQTAIDEHDTTMDLHLALSVASQFGLSKTSAEEIVREVGRATASWRAEAARIGIANREIDRMASAFEHDDHTMSITI